MKDRGSTGKPDATDDPRRAVRDYLRSLSSPRPRGRPVDLNGLKARRAAQDDPVEQLLITQRILEYVPGPSRADLESEFVKVARAWSSENRISWAAWREMGVPASILRQAGIDR